MEVCNFKFEAVLQIKTLRKYVKIVDWLSNAFHQTTESLSIDCLLFVL